MRFWTGALAVLLLLALLTWLLLRGFDTNRELHAATLQALDDFALAETSLQRDVLEARAGLLRNYDSLVRAVEAMREAMQRLRFNAQMEGLDAGPTDRLVATVTQQEELTERFKSSNALLQNSLSYVGLLSTTPAFQAQDSQNAMATYALVAAILYLTRDASPDAVKALSERIDQFAAQRPAAGPDAEAAQALLAHARLLRDLLPAVDDMLKRIVAMPSRPALEEVRDQLSAHRSAVERTAQRFRLLLYLTSLLLVVMLAYLGQRLRVRALAMRQRAAFEHVIAKNSTALINCPVTETSARLTQVLGELGQAIAADRAYVALEGSPARAYTWSKDGEAFPANWPRQALSFAAEVGTSGHDIVTLPDAGALPSSGIKASLLAAGVRGWICVPLVRQNQVRGIMGFESSRPLRDGIFPEPVLRLAGDAVANAVEREFLERDRARLSTRLERARRLQVVGSLASGIAHNFNNIIGAILGYSEMIENGLTPGSKPAQSVAEIRRAAERARDLVDNILAFGRRRDARVRPLRVRTLFDEAASLLKASLPAGIELVIDSVPPDLAVAGETAQLQQVILNLCTNAAQAMPGGGEIRLAAEQAEVLDFLPKSHGVLAPGRYVCLSVVDTGCGFDEKVAHRLFEPFFTTRATGTGLGLATVREIIRDHDGAINVHSRPGHGSRFEAWLPAAADDRAEAASTPLPLGRGETVLIVESERAQLLSDEETLAALGYEPVGFGHAADAVAACRATPDRFDLLLVGDIGLARTLHEVAPRHPLLLVTESTTDISIDALAAAGVSEVLRRPLASSELAEAMARALRSIRAPST